MLILWRVYIHACNVCVCVCYVYARQVSFFYWCIQIICNMISESRFRISLWCGNLFTNYNVCWWLSSVSIVAHFVLHVSPMRVCMWFFGEGETKESKWMEQRTNELFYRFAEHYTQLFGKSLNFLVFEYLMHVIYFFSCFFCCCCCGSSGRCAEHTRSCCLLF